MKSYNNTTNKNNNKNMLREDIGLGSGFRVRGLGCGRGLGCCLHTPPPPSHLMKHIQRLIQQRLQLWKEKTKHTMICIYIYQYIYIYIYTLHGLFPLPSPSSPPLPFSAQKKQKCNLCLRLSIVTPAKIYVVAKQLAAL
jgi:hypothetical protein